MDKNIPYKRLFFDESSKAARLDSWLCSRINGLSRRQSQKMIAEGVVTVNGHRAKKSMKLSANDQVDVWRAPIPTNWTPAPDPNVQVEIVYEEEGFIVVNKPSGISSVPNHPDDRGTLAQGVANRFPESIPIGRRSGDVGLIHRLDKETSGVVLAARDQLTFGKLLDFQKKGKIEKRYLALILAKQIDLPTTIKEPLAGFGPGSAKVRIDPNGLACSTLVQEESRHGEWILARAIITKGFRHQIRAHLAHMGFPIACDSIYGGEFLKGLDRLFLHAESITFPHPVTDKMTTITSPLPPDLQHVLSYLK